MSEDYEWPDLLIHRTMSGIFLLLLVVGLPIVLPLWALGWCVEKLLGAPNAH